MNLINIGRDVRSVYTEYLFDPKRIEIGKMMLQLVDALEGDVNGVQRWVDVQGGDLVIIDIPSPLGGRRVYVAAIPGDSVKESQYEITYFVSAPWWSVTGFTSDITQAKQMIFHAIESTIDHDKE